VALASAGPYAGLHLAPDKHANTLPVFLQRRMPFLPPNQQHQSTEGKHQKIKTILFTKY